MDPAHRERIRIVWDAAAAGWDEHRRTIADAARPVTDALIERLAPAHGQTILELAGGTGEIGHAVAPTVGDTGRVLVTDLSPQMIAAARRSGDALNLRHVDYAVMDAEEMPLRDDSVDGVICRWGYMLVPRPARAFAETRRVLRPGGRLACAVLADAARNPWSSLASRILVERGHLTPPAPGMPGIFALHDPHALERLVRGAGFTHVEIAPVPHAWRFPDGAAYWTFLTEAAGTIALTLARLDGQARTTVRQEIESQLDAFRTDAGYTLPALSLCVIAF